MLEDELVRHDDLAVLDIAGAKVDEYVRNKPNVQNGAQGVQEWTAPPVETHLKRNHPASEHHEHRCEDVPRMSKLRVGVDQRDKSVKSFTATSLMVNIDVGCFLQTSHKIHRRRVC